MNDLFGIKKEDVLNNSKVKILNGIAGAAKSSMIEKFFSEEGIEYIRFTSTNKLKRDAIDRYGRKAETIASGMFFNDDYKFYSDERDISYKHVVIDEILQTNRKVFSWVRNRVGKVNMIICTDDHQMMAPEHEEVMKEEFNSLKGEPYSISVDLTKTLRARDEETRKAYEEAYISVDTNKSLYYRFLNGWWVRKPEIIEYRDMEYRKEDVYICHTLKIEKKMYLDFEMIGNYSLDLIPKGTIAKNPPKRMESYPICPQEMLGRKTKGYWQVSNVCTASRYQGSEVKDDQKLYFLVNPKSHVGAREFYTVITRCYKIKSVVIVVVEEESMNFELKEYNGIPVVPIVWGKIESNESTKLLMSFDAESNSVGISLEPNDYKQLFDLVKKEAGGNKAIRDACLMFDGQRVYPKGNISYVQEKSNKIESLVIRHPEFAINMKAFYTYFEDAYRKSGAKGMAPESFLLPALYINEWEALNPFDENGDLIAKRRDFCSYQYAADMRCAFPSVLATEKMPTNSWIEYDKKVAKGIKRGGMSIDFFVVTQSNILNEGTVITGELKEQMESYGTERFQYVCSTSAQIGCEFGREILKKSFKCKESKDEIKEIHWGALQRKFLEPDFKRETMDIIRYGRDEANVYGLLMAAIKSSVACKIIRMRKSVYGLRELGTANVDCLYFDCSEYDLSNKIIPEFLSIMGDHHFRIHKPDNKEDVIFKTYPDLRTRAEMKAYKERCRRNKRKQLNDS